MQQAIITEKAIFIEKVILVDENDNEIGAEEKLKAHIEGKLHRAFSVFAFNSKKELLIQRRALSKYHSAGLWTNTCCSHPRKGETTEEAAHRRLKEELGIDCDLKEIHSIIYKKKFENGLTEHEFDHVFVGSVNDIKGIINFDKNEVEEWKFISIYELKKDLKLNPDKYTYWFKLLIEKIDFSD